MRHFQKELETREVSKFVKMTCDLCGKESANANDWALPDSKYHFAETTIERDTGHHYPEGGSGTKETVDLCPSCFDLVFAWLRSQGATIQTRDWDT